jgi:hypothetical protein
MRMGGSYELDTVKLDGLIASLPAQLDAYLRGVAEEMVSDIKLSFPASPSPEGGPPGVDTGTLRASIRWTKVDKLTYWIHDGVEYGIYQEYIYNRPFIAPVFEVWRRKLGRDAQQKGIIKA